MGSTGDNEPLTIDTNAKTFDFDDNFLSPASPSSPTGSRSSTKSIESINTQIETENMLFDEV